jgi:hypothetical protein
MQRNEPFRCVPARFTSPTTVTVRRENRGSFRLHVTVEPADRIAKHDIHLHVAFEIEGDGVVDRWDDLCRDWDVDAGKRVSDVEVLVDGWSQSAPAPRSTLRWTGTGVLPGSVEMDVPDGAKVDVPVVLRLDETGPLPGEHEAVVRVGGPRDAATADCWIYDGTDADLAHLDRLRDDIVLPLADLLPGK